MAWRYQQIALRDGHIALVRGSSACRWVSRPEAADRSKNASEQATGHCHLGHLKDGVRACAAALTSIFTNFSRMMLDGQPSTSPTEAKADAAFLVC